MPQFVILMTENDDAWSKLPEAEQTRLIKLYFKWVGGLHKKKAFVGGDPIGGGGTVLRRAYGKIVATPFSAKKDVLTGYFIVEAKNLSAAVKLARGCPALIHGEAVTVRPLGHM
ncbi:MAG: YciI family protein [Planctomycetes bacterium]|nr:YciI family protein [Planctomycetota bacterium]